MRLGQSMWVLLWCLWGVTVGIAQTQLYSIRRLRFWVIAATALSFVAFLLTMQGICDGVVWYLRNHLSDPNIVLYDHVNNRYAILTIPLLLGCVVVALGPSLVIERALGLRRNSRQPIYVL